MTARFLNQAWRRRAWFGLRTVLGLGRRGFFLPYRYAGSIPKAGARAPYAPVERLFETQHSGFAAVLDSMNSVATDLARIGADAPPAPRWNQSWFPRLDAAAAYTLVRKRRPKRIVEVGSGHSTRFLARAVADAGLETQITAIDPAPRAALDGLAIEFRRETLQTVGLGVFETLSEGDFLMIDSSHILMPGSDVDTIFGRVLPILPAGVLLHLHDVFLPDDYPEQWDWRGYNEQLGVLALLFGGAWHARFASHYVATRMADAVTNSVAAGLPLSAGALESSLWLEKRPD